MKIEGIVSPIKPIKPDVSGEVKNGAKSDFSDMFNQALKEVDQLQLAADDQIEGLTLQRPDVTTHSAMLALEKADVAFQLMNQIRTKIIRAYEEVLRTQV